jgi:hypothetical protein
MAPVKDWTLARLFLQGSAKGSIRCHGTVIIAHYQHALVETNIRELGKYREGSLFLQRIGDVV